MPSVSFSNVFLLFRFFEFVSFPPQNRIVYVSSGSMIKVICFNETIVFVVVARARASVELLLGFIRVEMEENKNTNANRLPNTMGTEIVCAQSDDIHSFGRELERFHKHTQRKHIPNKWR